MSSLRKIPEVTRDRTPGFMEVEAEEKELEEVEHPKDRVAADQGGEEAGSGQAVPVIPG